MAVLNFLAMKAAVSICVIGALISYHHGFTYKTEFTILYVEAIFIVLTLTANKLENIRPIITALVILCLLPNSVSENEFQRHQHFYEDNVWPYFQYKMTLIWCYRECVIFLKFIISLFSNFKVRKVDVLCYLLYLVTQAVVLLFIVVNVAMIIYSRLYLAVYENFVHSFDENITTSYAEGFFGPKVLNKTLYDNHVMHEQSYYQNKMGEYILRDDRMFTRDQMPQLPHFRYSVKRYLGEDVELTCGYRFIKGHKRDNCWTMWSLNGTGIHGKSSRHSTKETISESEYTYMDIQSTFTIRVLQKSDFGDYECRVHYFYYEKDATLKRAEKTLIKKTSLVGIISLEKIETRTTILRRDVGNLIASHVFFLYHTVEDISDIRIEYTINDKPVDVTCPGYSTIMCSLGANILKRNMQILRKIDIPYIDIGELERGSQLKAAVIYYCMCPRAFGIHRVNFIRYVNDSTRNKFVYMDIQHPYVFVVLPRSAPSLFRFSDDATLYAGIEDLVSSNQPLEFIEMKFEYLNGFVVANEHKSLLIANIIQNAVFVCLVVILCIVIKYTARVYFTYVLRKPVRRILYRLPNINHMPMIDNFVYDVYISHSEQEYEFVTQKLIPFLQDHVHLKVCFSASDAIEPNRSRIHGFIKCTHQSRKIILVLSQGYRDEKLCEDLQLQHIILPLTYENKRQSSDILCILYDEGARFPPVWEWNTHVQRLAWNNHLPENVKLESVRRWVTTGRLLPALG
ncbi:uncharacterized protein LOC127870710 [Dreissena polymorpha]|uniref:Soluble interferon alpha/beta receptor OPG204 n=1 Tax=Dreissena polymorpha TaxID=45954 RepID=A0A9D4LAJ4_DREPO|nr:uncharacterized protein LOC127870710 [Dreissena polymorpha]KAH3854254.1 hypothetical protein DPMN_096792 [Dreissena polymorpha]